MNLLLREQLTFVAILSNARNLLCFVPGKQFDDWAGFAPAEQFVRYSPAFEAIPLVILFVDFVPRMIPYAFSSTANQMPCVEFILAPSSNSASVSAGTWTMLRSPNYNVEPIVLRGVNHVPIGLRVAMNGSGDRGQQIAIAPARLDGTRKGLGRRERTAAGQSLRASC